MAKRLTQEQRDKFYGEYLRGKSKKFAGTAMEKIVWLNNLEMVLTEELGDSLGKNWSNTEIRRANRLLLRAGAWSGKQVAALQRNAAPGTELNNALAEEFGLRPQDVGRFIQEEQGTVFNFLEAWSGDWREYFNS